MNHTAPVSLIGLNLRTRSQPTASRCGVVLATMALATVATLSLAGCQSSSRGPSESPYAASAESRRDTAKAERLSREAAEMIESNPSKAEELLRSALAADLYHGPAHNNLGVLYLQQDKLYEAAGEFEWARKLLPGHPDPRMNLALVFESAGHTDDALSTYATALEVYPEHLPTMQALARLQVRSSRRDDRTPRLLREISLRGQSDEWKQWARLQVVKAGD